MMKKYKSLLPTLIIVFVTAILLSSCSESVPNESKIKTDLEETRVTNLFNSEGIDKIEVVKRNTDNDRKIDTVWIKIDSSDEEVAYIRYLRLDYQLYDQGGWILESVEPDERSLWASTPLIGVKEDMIKESIMGLRVNIDGDEWIFDQESISEIIIDSQNPLLEQKKDSASITVNLASDVLVAQGQMQLEFAFDNDWKMDDYRVSTPFESNFKDNAKFNLTVEQLITEVSKTPITFYSVVGSHTGNQIININSNDVSNFSIINTESQNKGVIQVLNCVFSLNKRLVTFDVEAKITYEYDKLNGWEFKNTIYLPKVKSVIIEGQWIGHYNASSYRTNSMGLNIDITNVSSDGAIEATVNFYPLPTNPSNPSGSLKAVGGIDFENLVVTIEGSEWIEQPRGYTFANYRGFLLADDSKIVHTGIATNIFTDRVQYLDFEVSKAD